MNKINVHKMDIDGIHVEMRGNLNNDFCIPHENIQILNFGYSIFKSGYFEYCHGEVPSVISFVN